jgi:hypothetical protein
MIQILSCMFANYGDPIKSSKQVFFWNCADCPQLLFQHSLSDLIPFEAKINSTMSQHFANQG